MKKERSALSNDDLMIHAVNVGTDDSAAQSESDSFEIKEEINEANYGCTLEDNTSLEPMKGKQLGSNRLQKYQLDTKVCFKSFVT